MAIGDDGIAASKHVIVKSWMIGGQRIQPMVKDGVDQLAVRDRRYARAATSTSPRTIRPSTWSSSGIGWVLHNTFVMERWLRIGGTRGMDHRLSPEAARRRCNKLRAPLTLLRKRMR
jgi:hypothetical protein